MRLYDVVGVGNALVDVLVEISEAQFTSFGLERGSMRLVDEARQAALLAKLTENETRLASGGSVANSVVTLSQLGARAGMICSLGRDRYGEFYLNEFESLGIRVAHATPVGCPTGTSLALITPDAERTLQTYLGAAVRLGPNEISEELIKNSNWLFIEGYVLANPELGPAAVEAAVGFAKKHKTQVALTISDAIIVTHFSKQLESVLRAADLVFCNESEACALTRTSDWRAAFDELKKTVPNVAVTAGAEGALVRFASRDAQISACPCKPVDLTGAGDVFAGTFLACIAKGLSGAEAGKAGCYLAREVITRVGARLDAESAKRAIKEAVGQVLA